MAEMQSTNFWRLLQGKRVKMIWEQENKLEARYAKKLNLVGVAKKFWFCITEVSRQYHSRGIFSTNQLQKQNQL